MLNLNNKNSAIDKPFSINKNGNIERTKTKNIQNNVLNEDVNVKMKDGESYKEFFKRAMKEKGIDKIENMSKEEKDKFFTTIENSWTKEDPKTNDKDVRDE